MEECDAMQNIKTAPQSNNYCHFFTTILIAIIFRYKYIDTCISIYILMLSKIISHIEYDRKKLFG